MLLGSSFLSACKIRLMDGGSERKTHSICPDEDLGEHCCEHEPEKQHQTKEHVKTRVLIRVVGAACLAVNSWLSSPSVPDFLW